MSGRRERQVVSGRVALLQKRLAICDSTPTAHAVEKAWNVGRVPGMATRLRFDTAGARLQAASAAGDEP